MHANLTKDEYFRQEIRCSDCGHKYLHLRQQLSCRCPRCGNIEYIPAPKLKSVLPPEIPLPLDEVYLEKFRKPVLATAVEEILLVYMQEWDLWAALVDHFDDAAYHSAYLSSALGSGSLVRAAERYRKHSHVMRQIPGESWQCKIASIQLGRISQLQLAQSESGLEKIFPITLPRWMFVYERTQKLLWIMTGMILWAGVMKILALRF